MKVSCTLVAYMTTSPQSKLMRLAEARLFTKILAGASSVMSLHLDGHSVGKDINYCDGRRWVLALYVTRSAGCTRPQRLPGIPAYHYHAYQPAAWTSKYKKL